MNRRTATLVALSAGGAAAVGAVTLANRAIREFEDLDVATCPKPGQTVQVRGVTLHYLEQGAGEPLLLVHGLGASTFSFRRNIPDLARDFHVFALDLMGFGYSERPARGDYSQTGHATRLADFIYAVGLDRAVVVGHSMGGAIALRAAAMFPERVERLVLVGSARPNDLRGLSVMRLLRPLTPLIAAAAYRNPRLPSRVLRSIVYDPSRIDEETIEGYVAPMHAKGHLAAFGQLAADAGRDQTMRMEDVRQPALIIQGADDRVVPPRVARWLHRRLPNARLEVLPECGHLVPEERPAEFDRLVAEFVSEGMPAAG